MEFLDPKLEDYVQRFSENEPEILAELNRETHLKVLQPRMLAGHLQGRVLSMLTHMIRPKRILEVGTYTGYSAICFSEGLAEGGQIHTIDINEELQAIQDKYFEKAGITAQVKRHVGDALEIIPKLDEDWDIVFLDADKENYPNYYDLVIDKMKPGSYVIADNVLWSGKILDKPGDMDQETKSLYEYSKKVTEDPRVQNVLFPIRDGLQISRKL